MRVFLKSKIQKPTITDGDVDYEGSIAIDEELLEKSNILEHEKVQIVNMDNGERLETYAILAPRGSGKIVMNGPAALKMKKGQRIIILAYEISDKPLEVKNIIVDEKNKFVKYYE